MQHQKLKKDQKTPLALKHSICIIDIFNKMALVAIHFPCYAYLREQTIEKYKIVRMV